MKLRLIASYLFLFGSLNVFWQLPPTCAESKGSVRESAAFNVNSNAAKAAAMVIKDPHSAAALMTKCIAVSDRRWFRFVRASAYNLLDHEQLAAEDLTAALRCTGGFPDDVSILLNRADSYFQLGDAGKCEHDLFLAGRLSPQLPSVHFKRASLYRATHRIALARSEEAVARKALSR